MLENLLSPNLGYKVFVEVSALLDVRYCPELQSCTMSMKTNEPNLRKWPKKSDFRPNFDSFGQNVGPKNFLVSFTSTRS